MLLSCFEMHPTRYPRNSNRSTVPPALTSSQVRCGLTGICGHPATRSTAADLDSSGPRPQLATPSACRVSHFSVQTLRFGIGAQRDEPVGGTIQSSMVRVLDPANR